MKLHNQIFHDLIHSKASGRVILAFLTFSLCNYIHCDQGQHYPAEHCLQFINLNKAFVNCKEILLMLFILNYDLTFLYNRSLTYDTTLKHSKDERNVFHKSFTGSRCTLWTIIILSKMYITAPLGNFGSCFSYNISF